MGNQPNINASYVVIISGRKDPQFFFHSRRSIYIPFLRIPYSGSSLSVPSRSMKKIAKSYSAAPQINVYPHLCQEGMANTLAWRIPWTGETGRLQSIGHRVRQDGSNLAHMHTCNLISCHISHQLKSITRCSAWSFAHREDSSSPLFHCHPEWRGRDIYGLFLHHTNTWNYPSVNQATYDSFFTS